MTGQFRHLVIVYGEEKLLAYTIEDIFQTIVGDWIIVTDDPDYFSFDNDVVSPIHAKQLLGREFKHAIFDARHAFNLDAFAILSGTLAANSMLILLLPPKLEDWVDQDSLRWNEQATAIKVPQFANHLMNNINNHQCNYPHFCQLIDLSNQYNRKQLTHFIHSYQERRDPQLMLDCNEQLSLLNRLKVSKNDIILLTAKRGRGKSALAGMLANHYHCWITAPNRNAVATLMAFAPKSTSFYAPDELIVKLNNSESLPDWLIIDEAAMIPLPMLTKLLKYPCRILLTSTVEGYEGTGQGLLLKLFQQISDNKDIGYYQLKTPIRWECNDPLEIFVDRLTLTNCNKSIFSKEVHKYEVDIDQVTVSSLTQHQLTSSVKLLVNFFGLLKTAHYQTTLIDLRRLLDATNLKLYKADYQHQLIGTLVLIEEGGLDSDLVEAIIKGYRRPRGNLVAQSLVAHGGVRQAAILNSLRINRIAIDQHFRRQGIASKMINQLIQDSQSKNYDYLSVSFAYSKEILNFWIKRGFNIVHVGTHKDASSGSYALMAIYPLSEAGKSLCDGMTQRLSRNWYWLKNRLSLSLPIEVNNYQQLDEGDRQELQLFATTSYAYSASLSVLYRLANQIKQLNKSNITSIAPLLLAQFDHVLADHPIDKHIVKHDHLLGKKTLIKLLRQEVDQLLKIKELFNEQ